MSIQIGHLAPRRVHLCVDTLGYLGDAMPFNFTAKAFLLPQFNAIIADRGSTFMARKFLSWSLDAGVVRFDQLLDRTPAAMRDLHAEYLEEHGEHLKGGSFDDLAGSEVSIFGWSEAEDRFVGRAFTSKDDFVPHKLPDGMLMTPKIEPDPSDPRMVAIGQRYGAALDKLKVPQTFVALGELQKIQCERDYGGGCGGDIVMFELTERGAEVRKIHRFADYAETVAKIDGGEPTAGQEAPRTRETVAV